MAISAPGAQRIQVLSPQFSEVVQEIVRQTKQPQLLEDIIRYAKSSLLTFHKMDRFWKDVAVLDWEATQAVTSRTIDLASSDFPAHRDILQVAAPKMNGCLKKIGLNAALGSWARNQVNCWYQLGTALHVRTMEPNSKLRIAYLSKPDFRDESLIQSWMLDEHQFAIIDDVAARIYGDTGQVEKQSGAASRVERLHKPEILREQMLHENAEILSNVGTDEY